MILDGKGDESMFSQEIHERIIKEINREVSDEKMRDLLKQLLYYEITLIDQGKPTFSSRYERIINSVYFK